MVNILDCTTRDGGFETCWNFEDKFVFEQIETLNKLGCMYYEIGYRNTFDIDGKGDFYCCSPDFLYKFYEKKGALKIGVMTDVKRFSYDAFKGSEKDCIDFVRVATHPQDITRAIEICERLHSIGYNIFLHLMDVSNIQTAEYFTLFEWKNKDIITSLYFADSYGTIDPKEMSGYFYKLKTLGYDKISFHAHNNNGKAYQNTLKAIELGAYSVDVTWNGMGRNGGNLNREKLLKNI